MMFAPHKLLIAVAPKDEVDENGDPISEPENWVEIGNCRCDDNSVMKQVSVNGKWFDYRYYVVYEGVKIFAGTKVRIERNEEVVEGVVLKSAKCNYFNYSQIWI